MSDQAGSIAVAAATQSDAPTLEATLQQKRLALGLISGCHVLNHLQYSITSVIFPVMMTELGFGLVGLGFISALSSFVGQGLQVIYGFLSNFFRRTTMLALGNVMVGLTAMAQYFVGSFPQLVTARVAIDAGSSPQHPLGSSLLSRYYPKARGWALTFHHSAGNLGSFLGPAAASLALLYVGWRTAFVIFGSLSLLMGLTLFLCPITAAKASLLPERRKPAQDLMLTCNVSKIAICFLLLWCSWPGRQDEAPA